MNIKNNNENLKEIALQTKRDYDILNMLNSISNFEVFTPFNIAESMVNLLPEDVFKHPEYKFLDPAVKSGIFLRQIIYKLDENLPRIIFTDNETKIKYNLADKRERITHILKNMIYGIAISELTGYVSRRTIYGVMEANIDKASEYLDSKILSKKQDIDNSNDLYFNDYYDHSMFNTSDRIGYEKEGNIFYPNEETTLETEDNHYPFIENTNHKFINRIKEKIMKFDVIIGNPPYQTMDGGHGASATPLYNKFVEEAKRLNPKHISMIIPARWYAGGKGLDDFRNNMISDSSIETIVDYADSTECFDNVDIKGGVCYFLWSKNYSGECLFINKSKTNEDSMLRKLDQFKPIIIRQNKSIDILNKVLSFNYPYLSKKISARKPFGLPTDFNDYTNEDSKNTYKIYGQKKISFVKKDIVPKIHESVDKWKVLLPYASDGSGKYPIVVLGNPIIAEPNSICSETYLVTSYFEEKIQAQNFSIYLKTKFVRFLISLTKNTQHFTRDKACFVPDLIMNKIWTDADLYRHFKLNKNEINYIEQTIRSME